MTACNHREKCLILNQRQGRWCGDFRLGLSPLGLEVLEKLGQKETMLWQTWPVGSVSVSPFSPFLGPGNEEDH